MGKNRSDREGGGVGFLIRNDIKDKVEIIDTTDGTDTEILWIKLKSSTNIAIATMYGKQETTPKDAIENQFEELTTQVNQLQQAWLNAILYVTHKNGLTGKNWRIVKELNSNLNARIRTKHGDTRTINIKDSIRQGGVLSVIEYANLMDEIAKELKSKKVGNQQVWNSNINGCLLWMDDVALFHHDREELQRMLDITDDIATRYHIKFGKEKSQVLTIGKTQTEPQFKLGQSLLDNTETYQYLGMTINNKGNLTNHLKKTKGKVEAALQTIFNLAGNAEFNTIEMSAIWRLVHTCIIPILTYGAEKWTPTKVEIKETQRILNNALKHILRAPITTPTEIITAETGIWDMETQISKKQIMQYYRIKSNEAPDSTTRKLATDSKNPWLKSVEATMASIEINTEELLRKNPNQAKGYVNKKLKEHQIRKIYSAAEEKGLRLHMQ